MSVAANLQFELVIDDAAFAPDTFQVVAFEGSEQINQPFQFTVDLVSYDPDITLAELATKPATLEVYRDEQQLIFHGLVAHFEQGPHVGDRYGYQAIFVPPIWFLSLTYQSRIFIERTVPEIIEEVLQEAGMTSQHYEFRLDATYPMREYLAQYQETDLNFVNRLAEREGIRYFFEEGKVVFSDELTSASPVVQGEAVLEYNPGGGLEATAEAVRTFTSREQVITGGVLARDYNYRTAGNSGEILGNLAMAPVNMSETEPETVGHQYEYGMHHQDQDNTDRLSMVRMDEKYCQRKLMSGTSGYVGLRVGHIMTVQGHFRDQLNGDFLLTRIMHQGTQAASLPGLMGEEAEDTDAYVNDFDCIPAEVQYRPPRITPVPKVPGIMTGVIESAGGDYAHLDEEGRYRVRMHFDDGDAPTAEASHWIRMKQAYSGPEYGIHFPNHEGTEMVWACIDGDPNRPMALGTTPNPSQKSPVTSQNKWQNIIRTYTSNEILMDDHEGATKISLTTHGGHNETLDDGEQNVRIITTGNNRAYFDDKYENIRLITTNDHTLHMDDKNRHVLLASTMLNGLILDDENRLIALTTTDGHTLRMEDEGRKVLLQSKEENKLVMDDANDTVVLETTGHNQLMMDDETPFISLNTFGLYGLLIDEGEKRIWLRLAGSDYLEMKDGEGVTLESPEKRVHIKGNTEIKLSVGDSNSITINQQGITIEGMTVTSKATAGNNVITGTPDVQLNC
ncbi:MAG TPA: type VI secretion system tip protein TssI/VgrG [Rhodothermales bacterium]|nr:type VI secretion system tip protein TssI/VgrG [Rhodothermales bacterium]